MAAHVIGLDIGRHAIKVVRVERRWGSVAVTRADALRVPRGGGDWGMIARRWLDGLPWAKGPCVVTLPGGSVILKTLTLAPGDPRTVRQAATLETEALNRMAGEAFMSDVLELPVQPESGARRGLLFVARPEALSVVVEPATRLGFDLIEVIPAPVALHRTLRHALPDFPGLLVGIDVGERATGVVISAGAEIRLVRTFELGVSSFAEAVAQSRDMTTAHAEELLSDGAVNISPEGDGDEPIREAVSAWRGEFELTLDLFKDRFPADAGLPRKVFLSGGGAPIAGLRELVAAVTGAEPALIPVPGLAAGSAAEAALYGGAAGAALTGMDDRAQVSLAPPAVRQRRTWRRERWAWVAALLLTVLALGVVGLRMARAAHFALQRFEWAYEAAARAARLQSDLRILREENARTLAMVRKGYDLAGNRGLGLRVIGALGDAKNPNDWIIALESRVPATNPVVARGTTPPTGETGAVARVPGFLAHGYTPDASFQSAKAMIRKLQQDPRIQAVELMDETPPGQTGTPASVWSALNASPFTLHISPAGIGTNACLETPPELSGATATAEADLKALLRLERAWGRTLRAGWADLRRRLATFKDSRDVFNLPAEEDVALIDFRVALMETRSRLLAQARQRGMVLPSDLGLGDVARADKSVRQSLYELATIRVLSNVALDGGVSGIDHIEPLPPVSHGQGKEPFMEEYPLRVTFKCRFPVLTGLLDEFGNPRHFMAVKNLRVERVSLEDADMVSATLEVAALVFPEGGGAEPDREEATHDAA
jgi:hypothetical protein